MPPPINDDKRAAILADIDSGTKSRNAISREHGVSPSTVAKVAQENGNEDAFDRTQTAHATRARVADNAARRAEIVSRLYEHASHQLDRLDRTEHERSEVSAGKLVQWTADDLPPQDVRALIQAAGHATQHAVKLESVDASTGSDDAASMLSRLAEGIRQTWQNGADSQNEPSD
ncbi:hypothetical protein FHX37_4202 [Haloactinospora alba]|uniref:Uncharacterized protein n=1 Tax=Haloactinospora alba TaxID=405555 RepID=A0A543N6M5_9ACTN|nr:hypothetical protein [Haloactinospora alba]TQN27482.1 hypothetical protein FHX37_4202 [Haloactinospora alba]